MSTKVHMNETQTTASYEGRMYKAVEDPSDKEGCRGCAFDAIFRNADDCPPCNRYERKDGKSVIYKRK